MDVATIYIDCTTTLSSPLQTGIQRVVRNVVRHTAAGVNGVAIVPVYLGPSGFHRAAVAPGGDLVLAAAPLSAFKRAAKRGYWAALHAAGAVAPAAQREWITAPASRHGLSRVLRHGAHRLRVHRSREWHDDGTPHVAFTARDILLLLDLSLERALPRAVDAVRATGTRIVCVCHDLTPSLYPEGLPRTFVEDFRRWMHEVLARSDGVVTISHAVAADVQAFLATLPGAGTRPRVATFRLGCDFRLEAGQHRVRPEVAALFAGREREPVFLAIGWIDARKNHEVLLDAVLQLHARGVAARLVIFGKRGRAYAAFIRRIRADPRLRHAVSVREDATDAEVEFAYRHCTALLYPSLVEGFGLPLVEALVRGTRVFASDIPVFGEIAGGHVVHFPPRNAEALAEHLHAFVATGAFPATRDPAAFRWPGWRESSAELIERTLAVAAA